MGQLQSTSITGAEAVKGRIMTSKGQGPSGAVAVTGRKAAELLHRADAQKRRDSTCSPDAVSTGLGASEMPVAN